MIKVIKLKEDYVDEEGFVLSKGSVLKNYYLLDENTYCGLHCSRAGSYFVFAPIILCEETEIKEMWERF